MVDEPKDLQPAIDALYKETQYALVPGDPPEMPFRILDMGLRLARLIKDDVYKGGMILTPSVWISVIGFVRARFEKEASDV